MARQARLRPRLRRGTARREARPVSALRAPTRQARLGKQRALPRASGHSERGVQHNARVVSERPANLRVRAQRVQGQSPGAGIVNPSTGLRVSGAFSPERALVRVEGALNPGLGGKPKTKLFSYGVEWVSTPPSNKLFINPHSPRTGHHPRTGGRIAHWRASRVCLRRRVNTNQVCQR